MFSFLVDDRIGVDEGELGGMLGCRTQTVGLFRMDVRLRVRSSRGKQTAQPSRSRLASVRGIQFFYPNDLFDYSTFRRYLRRYFAIALFRTSGRPLLHGSCNRTQSR